jgi:hypothetical protein
MARNSRVGGRNNTPCAAVLASWLRIVTNGLTSPARLMGIGRVRLFPVSVSAWLSRHVPANLWQPSPHSPPAKPQKTFLPCSVPPASLLYLR